MDIAIGKNIKRLRDEMNIKQETLANELNISFQAVSKWENGLALPDTALLPKIANYFNVTIDDLFNEDIKPYENMAIRLFAVYEQSHHQDDFFRADAEFKKLIQCGECTSSDLKIYGSLYQYHMHYCMKKAMDLYERVLKLEESNKSDLFYGTQKQIIALMSSIGKDEENIEKHLKILQDEPDNINNYYTYLLALSSAKQYTKAFECVKIALKKWPDNARLYLSAGDICRMTKDYDKAFEYLNRSLELDNQWGDAMYSKAFCYQDIGDKKNELAAWNKLIDWLEKRGLTIAAQWPKEMAERIVKEQLDKK